MLVQVLGMPVGCYGSGQVQCVLLVVHLVRSERKRRRRAVVLARLALGASVARLVVVSGSKRSWCGQRARPVRLVASLLVELVESG